MRTHNHPNVISSIETGDDLLKTFQNCNKLLEEIQKSLEDYLETKRSAFPRFYFLSNDELLAILSQTRDPTAVQPHVSKVRFSTFACWLARWLACWLAGWLACWLARLLARWLAGLLAYLLARPSALLC